jgi:hypothetical protein
VAFLRTASPEAWALVEGAQGFLDGIAWCSENRETVREHGRQWHEVVLAEHTILGTIHLWREALGVSVAAAA